MTASAPPPLLLRPALATAAILLVPAVAMRFTGEVVWNAFDFVVAGALLLGAGVLLEAALRRSDGAIYRAAAGLAIFATLLLVWSNLAVGIIGDERNPANALYVGVVAIGIVGAILSRARAEGMARTLLLMAVAQVAIALAALGLRWDAPGSGALEILGITALFVALFLGSGLLFHRAAATSAAAGAP
jgi:hypothetical protein